LIDADYMPSKDFPGARQDANADRLVFVCTIESLKVVAT